MALTVIIVCSIVIILLFKIFDHVKNNKKYELLEHIPSFPTYPLIGNLHMLCGSMSGVLKKLDRIFGTHDRSVFWMFSIPVVILKKHEDIMMILTQSQDRETLGLATEWIGTGLINAKYEDWKKSRKVLTPAFSSDMLSKYIEVFNERSLALVKVFKREADTGQVINVWDHLIKINVDTIVENVMGISITTCGEKGDKFGHAVYETFQNMIKRFIAPWLHPRLIYLAYLKITGKSNIIKDLHYLPTKILREKMAEYRRGSVQLGKNLEDFNNYFSKTVIHQLIREGIKEPSFDETRMRDELLHITGAAIETTALNVAFLMLMLAINQDIQQKVYEEITELLSDDDMLTPNHLFNHLKYLEQCLKETSRMFTSVIGTIRRTHKDCVLKDNVIIPANTLVFSAIHWAHYDKEAFKNPYKWDPEHFNEQAEQNRSKSGLLSFGYGPRSCIGAKYAMLSMKTQMAYILRNFHLSTNIKEFTYDDLYADVSIRSKIGYPIRFTSRTKLKQ
ncbi:cytochrome P450 4g15-like isoform X2 [Planococcus citri]|uniref:cytochrome P450 4g15-like isoform X2 n=1 Tax=Planococcus citri TaxID=170843 RepID=UPI0031F7B47B